MYSENDSFIPFHVPSIGEEEINEVVATLRSGWLTTGKRVKQFEQEICQYVGAHHAIAVNSATAGLHLALAAMDIGPGDEVITTPMTFCATVNTILHVGARPVLADIGPDGNIDPGEVARLITRRTRAILPVHMAGLPCDMTAIWALAKQHNLYVIEDAAHAIGAHYRGRPIGMTTDSSARSDATVFSFYATKNLTSAEGGMLTTHDEALASRMRILSLHGISKDAWNRYAKDGSWYYEVLACGFKYNMSDVHAAIGIPQLRKLEQMTEARIRIADRYNRAFANVDEVQRPVDSGCARHAWHLYVLQLDIAKLSIGRAEFIHQLRELGVGTSVHFIPIPVHPFYAQDQFLKQFPCPQALQMYERIVSLPIYPAMTDEQCKRVVDAVTTITARNRVARPRRAKSQVS